MRRWLLAEFESPDALVRAYDVLEREGFKGMRTWTPFPIKSIIKRLPESLVPYIMLAFGLFGGTFAYILQWWCNGKDFPINVGARPLHSAPSQIPITFETTVLFASLAGFFVALGFSGLPRLYHPIFRVEGFERASVDRFWLGVDGADPHYREEVADDLLRLGALRCEHMEVQS